MNQELKSHALRRAEPEAALRAEEMGMRPVYVHARVTPETCTWDRLLSMDWSVAGVYRVLVPLDAGDAHAANCALEGLFRTVAMELDHLKFTVYDAMSGAQLPIRAGGSPCELTERSGQAQLLGHLG